MDEHSDYKPKECRGCVVFGLTEIYPNEQICEYIKSDCPCKECLVKVTCTFGIGISTLKCDIFTNFVKLFHSKKIAKRNLRA
jgi:hypothetical protein